MPTTHTVGDSLADKHIKTPTAKSKLRMPMQWFIPFSEVRYERRLEVLSASAGVCDRCEYSAERPPFADNNGEVLKLVKRTHC